MYEIDALPLPAGLPHLTDPDMLGDGGRGLLVSVYLQVPPAVRWLATASALPTPTDRAAAPATEATSKRG
jgi:hypothetical protein